MTVLTRLGHRPRVLLALTLRFLPVVSAWLVSLHPPVRDEPFVSSQPILRQERQSADGQHPAARTGQEVTDMTLIAPPLRVASPCLFCNRSMTIMIDSLPAGPNAPAHRERPQRVLSD